MTKANRMRLGREMKAAREAGQLSQVKLCRRLKISQGTLSKIEHGETEPSVAVWLRFTDLFEVPVWRPLTIGRQAS